MENPQSERYSARLKKSARTYDPPSKKIFDNPPDEKPSAFAVSPREAIGVSSLAGTIRISMACFDCYLVVEIDCNNSIPKVEGLWSYISDFDSD